MFQKVYLALKRIFCLGGEYVERKSGEEKNPPKSLISTDDQTIITIDLTEFQRLRAEIDNRTTISEAVVLGYITALGSGVSLFEKYPDVLLALSFLSSFLWLSWLAHTYSISKLAGYIAYELAPRVRKHSHSTELLLGWEEYARTMSRAGVEAYASPYPPPHSTLADKHNAPVNIAGCILGLFATATPVLLIIYFIAAIKQNLIVTKHTCFYLEFSNAISDSRLLMMIISLIVWWIAIRQYHIVQSKWKAVDAAAAR